MDVFSSTQDPAQVWLTKYAFLEDLFRKATFLVCYLWCMHVITAHVPTLISDLTLLH